MSYSDAPRDEATAARATLETLRDRILELDNEIIRLIGERRTLAIEIGRTKQELDLPVLDPAREARVVRRVAERAREVGVDPELARDVIRRIISGARQAQTGDPSKEPLPRGPTRGGPLSGRCPASVVRAIHLAIRHPQRRYQLRSRANWDPKRVGRTGRRHVSDELRIQFMHASSRNAHRRPNRAQ